MKMAVFDFALRKKGVYGVLHIIIPVSYTHLTLPTTSRV